MLNAVIIYSILIVINTSKLVFSQPKYSIKMVSIPCYALDLSDNNEVLINYTSNGSTHIELWKDNSVIFQFPNKFLTFDIGPRKINNNKNLLFDIYNNGHSDVIWKEGDTFIQFPDNGRLNDLNNSLTSVGYTTTCTQNSGNNAVRYKESVAECLVSRGAIASNAIKINDNNIVVGQYYDTTGAQYRAVYWNQNGEMTYLTSPPNATSSAAIDINDVDNIVGVATIANTTRFIYWKKGVPIIINPPDGGGGVYSSPAIMINKFNEIIINTRKNTQEPEPVYWRNGEVYWLSDLISNQHNLYYVQDINDRGTILCGLVDGNSYSNLLLEPTDLRIHYPTSDILWVAGEKDTIKWSGGSPSDSIKIEYSTDKGNTYKLISNSTSINKGGYEHTFDANFRSRKVLIRLKSISDTSRFTVSDTFRVKPIELTRIDLKGDYEPFQFGRDNWNFSNTEKNMYPRSWWQQFDYRNGVDPYTGKQYPSEWRSGAIKADSSDFPDWPLFVKTFGVDRCYYSTFLGFYKISAISLWASNKKKWGGSCYGLALSSLMTFDNSVSFLNAFPDFGGYVTTFLSNIDDNRRQIINALWNSQSGEPHLEYYKQVWNKKPKQTVKDIREMFLAEQRDDRVLVLYNQNGSGAHAITPYRLEPNPLRPEEIRIYVYDNNHAGNTTLRVIVDTLKDFWTYSEFPTWGGSSGLFLMDPVSGYLIKPPLPKNTPYKITSSEPALSVYFNNAAFISIVNETGDTTGYQNGLIIKDDTSAIPIIPITGYEHPPIGFLLSNGGYRLKIDKFQESETSVSLFNKNFQYIYYRTDVDSTQQDVLEWNKGLTLSNNDAVTKQINISSLEITDTAELFCELRNASLAMDDSIRLAYDQKGVSISNYGVATNYDLALQVSSLTNEIKFVHSNVVIPANATQLVVPQWSDLTNQPVKILIDIDNDGISDDSLFVENQITNVGIPLGESLPTEFCLYQNYPNPFNPVTTIQYSIPERITVTLKVFDVLGSEVTTLVNEQKERGVYSISFDASQFASGIYFYKIIAGSFTETKKMILIR